MDKEKIFAFSLLFISITLIIFSLFSIASELKNTKTSDDVLDYTATIKGFDYYFSFNSMSSNGEMDESKLLLAIKSLGIDKNYMLDIIPRISANLKLKGNNTKNIYTNFEWEIPSDYFQTGMFGDPLKNYLFRIDSSIYPGAPRYYRHGIHRGFDFSDRKDGSIAKKNELIFCVYPGEIVKIKNNYQQYGEEEKFDMYRMMTSKDNFTDDKYLDFFRGNQVYVRNGSLFFIYAHLDSITKGLKVGDKISKGDIIGLMGNSGVEYMGTRAHLHLEVYFNGFLLGINRLRRNWETSFDIYQKMFGYSLLKK